MFIFYYCMCTCVSRHICGSQKTTVGSQFALPTFSSKVDCRSTGLHSKWLRLLSPSVAFVVVDLYGNQCVIYFKGNSTSMTYVLSSQFLLTSEIEFPSLLDSGLELFHLVSHRSKNDSLEMIICKTKHFNIFYRSPSRWRLMLWNWSSLLGTPLLNGD